MDAQGRLESWERVEAGGWEAEAIVRERDVETVERAIVVTKVASVFQTGCALNETDMFLLETTMRKFRPAINTFSHSPSTLSISLSHHISLGPLPPLSSCPALFSPPSLHHPPVKQLYLF